MDISPDACSYPGHSPPVPVPLTVLGDHGCSYLPGRVATSRGFFASGMPPELYHQFMDAGFRRSGRLVYQPICRGCRACLQLRVPVDRFVPSKSQRRCWRRNQDLIVSVQDPEPTDEKFDLYTRYQTKWHSKEDGGEDRESFESFLYDSPVQSVEFSYRDGSGKLLAVGICDVASQSLSSVYFYHDPVEFRRGLGIFGALYEIAKARALSIPHYYLGFWVAGCAAMEYKAAFEPNEILSPDGQWRPRDPQSETSVFPR